MSGVRFCASDAKASKSAEHSPRDGSRCRTCCRCGSGDAKCSREWTRNKHWTEARNDERRNADGKTCERANCSPCADTCACSLSDFCTGFSAEFFCGIVIAHDN